MAKSPLRIQEDVHAQLEWDSAIGAASAIRVNVTGQEVTLEGNVPSYSERRRAENDAYMVAGVKKVENFLTVQPDRSRPLPGDNEIAEGIRGAISWLSGIDPVTVEVSVASGVAVLGGSVKTIAEKLKAEELAGEVRGVCAVNNRLTVEKADPRDAEIRNSVAAALRRTMGEAADRIGVTVSDGVVRLDGTALRCADYHIAEDIARRTAGVAGVRNTIDTGCSVFS